MLLKQNIIQLQNILDFSSQAIFSSFLKVELKNAFETSFERLNEVFNILN